MAQKQHFVDKELRSAIETFNGRNDIYGDSYIVKGEVMSSLFPNGITLKTKHDFSRFGVFDFIITKLIRYANNFKNGHYDSMHDIETYAAMLSHLTQLELEQDDEDVTSNK